MQQEQEMIGHYLPDLVKLRGDNFEKVLGSPRPEIEALVQFDLTYIGQGAMGRLFEAERLLRSLDVDFDTGAGCGARDWEMDWSLKGPVRIRLVRFKGQVSFWQRLEILFTGNINPRAGLRRRIRDFLLRRRFPLREVSGQPQAGTGLPPG